MLFSGFILAFSTQRCRSTP